MWARVGGNRLIGQAAIIAILATLLPLSSAYAQNPRIPLKPIRSDRQPLTLPVEAPAQPPAAPQTPPVAKTTRKSCTLVISKLNPARQLVLDENGVYQHRVRETELKTRLGSTRMSILTVKMWDGVFPPDAASIETETLNVKESRVVEEEVFKTFLTRTTAAPAASRAGVEDQFEE